MHDQVIDPVELRVALPSAGAIGTLGEARAAIDELDAALAVLLEHRAAVAAAVQRLKPVGGFVNRDPGREREIVEAMAERARPRRRTARPHRERDHRGGPGRRRIRPMSTVEAAPDEHVPDAGARAAAVRAGLSVGIAVGVSGLAFGAAAASPASPSRRRAC